MATSLYNWTEQDYLDAGYTPIGVEGGRWVDDSDNRS